MKKLFILLWIKAMRIGYAGGCHQIPERSFFIKGWQFPVCARCTGILLGQIIFLILFLVKIYIPIYLCFVFLFIMFLDWLIQYLELKQSTNIRRLITGTLAGIAEMRLFIYILAFLFNIIKIQFNNFI